jgi:hypothetical protein
MNPRQATCQGYGQRSEGSPFSLESTLGVTATKRKGRRFTVVTRIAAEPMPVEEWRAAESLLARLVARAYAADHPELFRPAIARSENEQGSGPPAATAVVAGALPANADGPDRESGEHDSRIEHEDT